VEKILFLGDFLVAFGEYLENNKPLDPSPFTEEWWAAELSSVLSKEREPVAQLTSKLRTSASRLRSFLKDPLRVKPTAEEALELSRELGIPLHPRYTFFWNALSTNEVLQLREALSQQVKKNVKQVQLELDERIKGILEKLVVQHEVKPDKLTIDEEESLALLASLGLDSGEVRAPPEAESPLGLVRKLSGLDIRDKAPAFISARMGRPEKAKERQMTPPPHVLFPVGLAGGPQRNVVEAARRGVIEVEIVRRRCPHCGAVTHSTFCPSCKLITKPEYVCPTCNSTSPTPGRCKLCRTALVPYETRSIDVGTLLKRALEELGVEALDLVKGVKSLTNTARLPEPLGKGVLRARHGLFVFKDGTIRFDVSNAPLTHFKPSEIGVACEKLRKLGYSRDAQGKPLRSDDQLCELKIQDVVIPKKGAQYLIKVAKFLDELLQNVYGLPPCYRVDDEDDLIGHLIVGLAPHTSVGVLGRIIGFTPANVCYAHPVWHAAKRRDCDGDEDSIMLALDVLLNFSKEYLPAQIGGTMDAPLLIIPVVDPQEVDDEAHNMDVVQSLSLSFYEKSLRREDPRTVSQVVETLARRLGTPAQYEGFHFTHDTSDINAGNLENVYKKLKTMAEKLTNQLAVMEMINAVDIREAVKGILLTHLIRDIAGNLRAFTTQKFRCKRCNKKFRRIPLRGFCSKCGGELTLTVQRGGIEKYLQMAYDLIERYRVEDYHAGRIALIRDDIAGLFAKEKQLALTEFL
jgi:DNA polymerase II large subunit